MRVETVPEASERPEQQRVRLTWDFLLVLVTVGILGALGAQSLFGTLYSWWAYRSVPGWEQVGYPAFVETMNLIAAPLVIALVVVMGLCVPKRLFTRRALASTSALMVGAGLATWAVTASIRDGLMVYLAASALIQVAVVALTLAGVRSLGYLSLGRAAKVGSGLLHLGFIVFAAVVVGMQESSLMLPVFAVAAVLMVGGSVLSFYARPTAAEREEVD